jgi:hypothetical protein
VIFLLYFVIVLSNRNDTFKTKEEIWQKEKRFQGMASCKLNREREKSMSRKKIFSPQNIIWSALLLAFVGAAIVDQVRRPPEDRTWYGKLVGIPYDFRFPSVERIRATFWNKSTQQVLVPQVFGIGWTINLYPIIHPETSK